MKVGNTTFLMFYHELKKTWCRRISCSGRKPRGLQEESVPLYVDEIEPIVDGMKHHRLAHRYVCGQPRCLS
jgi:hypothetical protein